MALAIYTQPNPLSTGITYARSPVIYLYYGCAAANSYFLNIYCSGGTALTTIYTSIQRTSDTNNKVKVDISQVLMNYLNLNPSLDYINYKATLLEYSGSTISGTTLLNTITSNSGISTRGYNIIDGYISYTGILPNYTPVGDYVMSSYLVNNGTHQVQSGSNNTFYWRKLRATGWKVSYTKTNLSAQVDTYTWSGTAPFYTFTLSALTTPNYNYPVRVDVLISSATGATYNFNINDCRKSLVDIVFDNKYGMPETIGCIGRIDAEMTTTSDIYKYNTGIDENGYLSPNSYNQMNTQGRNKIYLNTGWLDEGKNKLIQELFLSNTIDLIDYNGDLMRSSICRVVLKDASVKYKTDVWDKLINYTLIFEEAFDKINNLV